MKKLFFIFLCLLAFYLAGMYRYRSLMVLACLEAVFFFILFLLSRYFERHLSVEALKHSDFVEKLSPLPCGLRVDNRGRLPVSRFRIRIRYGYGRGKRPAVRHVYGGGGQGESIFRFEATGSFCGMMCLTMDRLRVYDYLNLFSSSKKLKEEMKVAVFPRERALRVELPSLCYRENDLRQEQFSGGGEAARNEVRQLREYRPGDSRRHIHWNQSARTGQLWVKEYEKETDYRVGLYLVLEGFWEADSAELDGFYELLSALVLGLLEKAAAVRVCWYDGREKCFADVEVSDPAQCREVLLALYRMEPPEEDGGAVREVPCGTGGEPVRKELCGKSGKAAREASCGTGGEPVREGLCGKSGKTAREASCGTSGESVRKELCGKSGKAVREAPCGTDGEPVRKELCGKSGKAAREASCGTDGESAREGHDGKSGKPVREASCGTDGESTLEVPCGTGGEPAWEVSGGLRGQAPGRDGFRLDLQLGWYWGDSLIFRFSREELDDQIAHKIFVV